MRTKEEKNTSTMPLCDYKVVDKIYIHPRTGDEINLGPFLEFIYWHDNRMDMDFDLQKVISFIDTTVGELIKDNDVELLRDYPWVIYFLKSLKDSIWLMRVPKPEQIEKFHLANWEEQYADLKTRFRILGSIYGNEIKDKDKAKNLVGRIVDELQAEASSKVSPTS